MASLVDYLKSNKLPSDIGFRSKLYETLNLGSADEYKRGTLTGSTSVKLLSYLQANPDLVKQISGSMAQPGATSATPFQVSAQTPQSANQQATGDGQLATDANGNVVAANGQATDQPQQTSLPSTVDQINQFQADQLASSSPQDSLQQLSSQISDVLKQAFSPVQTTSLVDTLNNLRTQQGLPALEAQALDLSTIMKGTADDVRKEVQNTGGVATESQIQQIVAQRNNLLLKQYDAVQQAITMKNDYIDKVMAATQQDQATRDKVRQEQEATIENLLGLQQKQAQIEATIEANNLKYSQQFLAFQEKKQNDARAQIKTLFDIGGKQISQDLWDAAGYDGTPPEISKNPQYTPPFDLGNGDIAQVNTNTGQIKVVARPVASAKNTSRAVGSSSKSSGAGGVFNGLTVPEIANFLVSGQLAPSQLTALLGRASKETSTIRQAVLSYISQKFPDFNFEKAEQQFKFGSSQQTNQIIASAKNAIQTAQRAVTSSNQVDRTDLTFLNGLVVGGKAAMSDPATVRFITDVNALGDEIGTVLGQGSATDFKTQLGLIIANKNLSKEGFATAMDELVHLFQNRIAATQTQAGQPTADSGEGSTQDVYSTASEHGYSKSDVDALINQGYSEQEIISLINQ